MGDEEAVLDYFFSNKEKPIFAVKNMPPAIQSYFYMGVSRFPKMRERFLKMLRDKNCFEKVAEAAKQENGMEQAIKPLSEFSAEKNAQIYFEFGHKSAAEGSSIFFVSEENPIYATEMQQDFYYPITTMEFSTRYAKKFGIDRVYWDPGLMKSEFAEEAKETIAKNLELYGKGFETLLELLHNKKSGGELPEKVSALDSLRFLIPIACHTSVILGGNTRSVVEHLGKLLAYKDSFVQHYTKRCIEEANKAMPEYFKDLEADQAVVKREESLGKYGKELFKGSFSKVKEDVKMHFELETEELALSQILYPYCSLGLEEIWNKVNGFTGQEKAELFKIATENRKNKANPVRGLETRPIAFEIESPWALWKDFKRNRMNLRFQQEIRGLAGFEVPELIKGSEMEKDYRQAMQKTSGLVEKVFQKHGPMSKTVAAQGSRKRYLLCMGARQLTVLTELRTSGEGDKGYRKIASRMIQLAKDKNPRMFAHVKDNLKNPEKA